MKGLSVKYEQRSDLSKLDSNGSAIRWNKLLSNMSKLVVLNLVKGSLQESFDSAIAQKNQRDEYTFLPIQ